jgi:TnpA family transposase
MLARALQDIGRAPKRSTCLDYCNDEHFRRRVLVQLNQGRHDLARRRLPRRPVVAEAEF